MTQRVTRQGTFASLRNPRFLPVAATAFLWSLGRWMESVTLLWLVLELTDSAGQVALLGAFRTAPMFLFGLLAGSLADRLPKRTVLLGAQLLNVVATGVMWLLLLLGAAESWHAFLVVFSTGTASTIDFGARRVYYADIFAKDHLANAISFESALRTVGRMVGPLLGGGLMTLVGFQGAYGGLLAIESTALVILLFFMKPTSSRMAREPLGLVAHVLESVALVLRNRLVLAAMLVTVTFNFFGTPLYQMVPVIARDVLGVGAELYGLLDAATGVGAAIGAILIASVRIRRLGGLYFAGSALLLVSGFVFALSSIYWLSFTLLLLAGAGMSAFGIMQVTIPLNATTPNLRGRALGAIALSIGAGPLGMVGVGQTAERLGAPISIMLFTGGGLAALLLIWRLFPELARLTVGDGGA